MSTDSVQSPEFQESGDPQWIDAELKAGGAFAGIDRYAAWGRWRERMYPTGDHLADMNPLTMGRVGLHQALFRFREAYAKARELPEDREVAGNDPTALAIVATYDVLEWAHSLDEHLRLDGRYPAVEGRAALPSDLDATYGVYVDGAIAARNASHHGLRRVVGLLEVPRPVYAAEGRRWVHTGTYSEDLRDVQVRWVRHLPSRPEAGEADRPVLRSPAQIRAFQEHLAGREVRNTFAAIDTFFSHVIDGTTPPANVHFGPAYGPPPIDPVSLVSDSPDAVGARDRIVS